MSCEDPPSDSSKPGSAQQAGCEAATLSADAELSEQALTTVTEAAATLSPDAELSEQALTSATEAVATPSADADLSQQAPTATNKVSSDAAENDAEQASSDAAVQDAEKEPSDAAEKAATQDEFWNDPLWGEFWAEDDKPAAKTPAPAAATEAQGELSQAVLAAKVSSLLQGKDLTCFSMKDLRQSLEQTLGIEQGGLDQRRDEITELAQAEIQRIVQAAEQQDGEDTEGNERDKRRRRKRRRRNEKEPDDGERDEDEKDDKEEGAPETPEKRRRKLGKRKQAAKNLDWRQMLRRREARAGKGQAASQNADGVGAEDVSLESNPTSRKAFLQAASSLSVQIAGQTLELPAKCFASSSCGYYAMARLQVTLDGVQRELQCQVNCAVLGSDRWSD